MTRFVIRLLPLAAFLLIVGCAIPQNEYNRRIAFGAYGEAKAIADKEAAKKNNDELLWQLQAGAAASYSGNAEESIRHFDLAEDIFQRNDTESVFARGAKETSAILSNDLAFDYNGMGLDRSFCCLYKAIDFAVLGKMNSARTELNRALQHQENWVNERKKDVEAAYKRLEKECDKASNKKSRDSSCISVKADGIASDQRMVKIIRDGTGFDYNEYGNLEQLAALNYTSIYLAHLCGVFRWLDNDGGRNFLRDAATLAPQNPLLAEDFRNADNGMGPGSNVWIYVEDGLCCHRQEWTAHFPVFLLPFSGDLLFTASMSFPLLRERLPAAEAYYVETSSGTSQMLFLESIDRLVRTEYGIFMRGAVPREITRIVMRVSSQAALGIAANNTRDDNARLMLRLSQLAVCLYGITTSKADTRSWEALPKNVFVHKVPCPADGKLRIKAGNMQTIELEIPKNSGTIIWVRRPTAFAPPTTKVISFR